MFARRVPIPPPLAGDRKIDVTWTPTDAGTATTYQVTARLQHPFPTNAPPPLVTLSTYSDEFDSEWRRHLWYRLKELLLPTPTFLTPPPPAPTLDTPRGPACSCL